jgi:hypothetical protein
MRVGERVLVIDIFLKVSDLVNGNWKMENSKLKSKPHTSSEAYSHFKPISLIVMLKYYSKTRSNYYLYSEMFIFYVNKIIN